MLLFQSTRSTLCTFFINKFLGFPYFICFILTTIPTLYLHVFNKSISRVSSFSSVVFYHFFSTFFLDQEIMYELEKEQILIFTPARRVGGKRVVCYDDRYFFFVMCFYPNFKLNNGHKNTISCAIFISLIQN